MPDDSQPKQPFDEQAAEEELGRIRASLDEWRARRQQAAERFDDFLRSFTTPGREPRAVDPRGGDRRLAQPAPAAAPAPAPRSPEPSVSPAPAAAAPAAAGLPPLDLGSTPQSEEPFLADLSGRELWPPEPAAKRPAVAVRLKVDRRYAIGGGVLLAGAAALVVWLIASPGVEAPANPPATPDAGPPAATVPAPEPSAPAGPTPEPSSPATAAAPGFQVEVTTTRQVWLRVMADGERIVEREVPAGERITVPATEAIVIRAGDGASVRVTVNGKDTGPFGPEGFPRTRTFTRPQ